MVGSTGSPKKLLTDHGTEHLVDNHARIPHARIKMLHTLVNESEIVTRLNQWRDDERKAAGGRPSTIDDAAVLTLILALAVEYSPILVTKMAHIVTTRLSAKSLKELGPFGQSAKEPAWYHRLHRRLHNILDLIDPKPGPHRENMTKAEWAKVVAGRDAVTAELKQDRLDWLTNELLYLTFKMVEAHMERWKGNVCIDATICPVYDKRGWRKNSDHAPAEYDAGWYTREQDWRDVDNPRHVRKSAFGYDVHFAIATTNDGYSDEDDFPYLILGMSCSKPSVDVSGFAMTVFKQINARHHEKIDGGLMIADRGYVPAAKPENLQLPLRQMGMGIVTDYKVDQLGPVENRHGADQIEGAWYCTAMPDDLKYATALYRAGKIDEETWNLRIAARAKYQVRPKGAAPNGGTVMMCPAAGAGCLVQCEIKNRTWPNELLTKRLITREEAPNPPLEICNATYSTTFSALDGAKLAQDVRYGTPRWKRLYATARNSIEGTNAILKDQSREGLAEPGRRRVRGYAARFLMIACIALASNLR